MSDWKPEQEDALCWLCGSTALPHPTLSAVGFWQCSSCGFVFQARRDSADDEAARYTPDYFHEYGGRSYETPGPREREARSRADFVQRHLSEGRILEVGAASGYFVAECLSRGFEAEGIEPSAATAQLANDREIPIRPGTLASTAASGRTYDAICAWHVLEHLPQTRDALRQLAQILVPGGTLFLEVPNVGSAAAQRFGAGWRHLDAANHVAHFDVGTLTAALDGCGFAEPSVHTVGTREYSRWRALHVVYDLAVYRIPNRVHPTRHELIRAVARTSTRPA